MQWLEHRIKLMHLFIHVCRTAINSFLLNLSFYPREMFQVVLLLDDVIPSLFPSVLLFLLLTHCLLSASDLTRLNMLQ